MVKTIHVAIDDKLHERITKIKTKHSWSWTSFLLNAIETFEKEENEKEI